MKSATCLRPPVFGLHRQPQIGPVEAVHEHRRRTAEKLLQNIRARGGVGRGGERDRLHAAERGLHRAERRVFRTKIVAPLRDAMRLVDRQQRDLFARLRRSSVSDFTRRSGAM